MAHDKEVPAGDESAARRLIARYAHLVDDRCYDEAADLFTPDGRVVDGHREHAGHDAVVAWLSAAMAPMGDAPTQHQISNVVVSYGSKPDTAHAVCDLALLHRGGQGWAVAVTGRYHDTFAGHGRDMRFSQRVVKLV